MGQTAYTATLDYLYSFIDNSVTRRQRYTPDGTELQRMHSLLERLGDPQNAYPTVHIAGTKGKGSVSAMVAAILQAAGYKVGLYTSPHLQRFTERIQINRAEISEEEVVALVSEIKSEAAQVEGLTTYDLITALGFLYFARREVDCAVVEVGLGGRLDPTNVLEPRVAVITSISYDHMYLLGNSLSDIAREKGGIIKTGIPIVLAPQQPEVELVVTKIAEEREAPLKKVGQDWLFSPGRRGLDGQTFFVWSSDEQERMDAYVESAGSEAWAPPKYSIPLLGYHQIINAAVSYAAIQAYSGDGFPIGDEAIREGFEKVRWSGRFEVLNSRPAVVVDAAHNRDSALKLRIAMDDYFPGRPVTLIFGASRDKDLEGMLGELLPRVSKLIVTKADHPRAADPDLLTNLAHSHGVRVEVIHPVAKALEIGLKSLDDEDVLLVTGSLFVVGEALAAWDSIQMDAEVKELHREKR
jgi:dihydrofolate synthase/folylpolyglutamate synthase